MSTGASNYCNHQKSGSPLSEAQQLMGVRPTSVDFCLEPRATHPPQGREEGHGVLVLPSGGAEPDFEKKRNLENSLFFQTRVLRFRSININVSRLPPTSNPLIPGPAGAFRAHFRGHRG